MMGDYEDDGFASSRPAEGYSACDKCFDDEHIAAFIESTTEWFRTMFHSGKSSLGGIIYPSTQNPGGRSVVLFANRNDVFLSPAEIKEAAIAEKTEEWVVRNDHEEAWLKLVRRRTARS